jgi:hypothetical protein
VTLVEESLSESASHGAATTPHSLLRGNSRAMSGSPAEDVCDRRCVRLGKSTDGGRFHQPAHAGPFAWMRGCAAQPGVRCFHRLPMRREVAWGGAVRDQAGPCRGWPSGTVFRGWTRSGRTRRSALPRRWLWARWTVVFGCESSGRTNQSVLPTSRVQYPRWGSAARHRGVNHEVCT